MTKSSVENVWKGSEEHWPRCRHSFFKDVNQLLDQLQQWTWSLLTSLKKEGFDCWQLHSCNLLPNCNFIGKLKQKKNIDRNQKRRWRKKERKEIRWIVLHCIFVHNLNSFLIHDVKNIYYINLNRVRNWCYVISKEQCQRAETKTMFSLEEKILICI